MCSDLVSEAVNCNCRDVDTSMSNDDGALSTARRLIISFISFNYIVCFHCFIQYIELFRDLRRSDVLTTIKHFVKIRLLKNIENRLNRNSSCTNKKMYGLVADTICDRPMQCESRSYG